MASRGSLGCRILLFAGFATGSFCHPFDRDISRPLTFVFFFVPSACLLVSLGSEIPFLPS